MRKILLFLFLFSTSFTFSQGSLVLIGGGGESNGGWSDSPYTWALNQSQNRKVAVIYYSSSTSWIPEYFMDLGASDTARFDIDNSTLANSQAIYDSLMNYDVFFIKGGNQWDYYNTWNDTKVEDAIHDKFNQGGVIMGTSAGMAILSEVIFTAENGTVYPDEAMENIFNNDITIKDDFLNIFPTYIFDSHFVERGRFPRLLAFIANYYWVNNQTIPQIKGLGVDDRTALCIDSNNIGIVKGSAAVSIFKNGTISSFPPITGDLDIINAEFTQLINGNKYNFNTEQIIIPPNAIQLNPPQIITYINYLNTLFICGSDSVNNMDSFISKLHLLSSSQDSTFIYTCNTNRAQILENSINNLGFSNTKVIDINIGNGLPQSDFTTPKRILFYENEWDILNNFFNTTTNGNILKTRLKDGLTITAFAGQDSKFVGTTFCSNIHDNVYGGYYGELEFKKGINLIKSSIFMPNTYDEFTSSYYENTTSAIPFVMVKDTLKYGFYLSRNSFLEIYQLGTEKTMESQEGPTICLTNNGTTADTATSYVHSSQNFLRQIVGFDNFRIDCVSDRTLTGWGSVTTPNSVEETLEEKGELLNITNILGENIKEKTNTPLLYRYENGTIEKRIIIE